MRHESIVEYTMDNDQRSVRMNRIMALARQSTILSGSAHSVGRSPKRGRKSRSYPFDSLSGDTNVVLVESTPSGRSAPRRGRKARMLHHAGIVALRSGQRPSDKSPPSNAIEEGVCPSFAGDDRESGSSSAPRPNHTKMESDSKAVAGNRN
eukprot:scaffold4927_cov139-Amphora_coffeaeformis.AAC.20